MLLERRLQERVGIRLCKHLLAVGGGNPFVDLDARRARHHEGRVGGVPHVLDVDDLEPAHAGTTAAAGEPGRRPPRGLPAGLLRRGSSHFGYPRSRVLESCGAQYRSAASGDRRPAWRWLRPAQVGGRAGPSCRERRAAQRRVWSVLISAWARSRSRDAGSGAGPRIMSPSSCGRAASTSACERAHGDLGVGCRHEHPNQPLERRVAELLSALELPGQKLLDRMPRRQGDRAKLGVPGLDDHRAGGVTRPSRPPRRAA